MRQLRITNYSFKKILSDLYNDQSVYAAKNVANSKANTLKILLCIADKFTTGKSYLCTAIIDEITLKNEKYKTIIIDGVHFSEQYVYAVRTTTQAQFFANFEHLSVFVCDNVNQLCKKQGSQLALSRNMNVFLSNKEQIVLTSQIPIENIKITNADLGNIFKTCINVTLPAPNKNLIKQFIYKYFEIEKQILTDELYNKIVNSNCENFGVIVANCVTLAYRAEPNFSIRSFPKWGNLKWQIATNLYVSVKPKKN